MIATIVTKIDRRNIIAIRTIAGTEIDEINILAVAVVATKMINEIDETSTTGMIGRTEIGAATERINGIMTRIVATGDHHLAKGSEGLVLRKAREELAQGASLRSRTILHPIGPHHRMNFLPLHQLESLPV